MNIKSTVTAFALLVTFSLPRPGLAASEDRSADLLNQLAQAEDAAEANRLEREIRLEWSKSGSAAMDLLLKRGQDALEVQDAGTAIEHLTALTDHAPDFAEGWHALAQAYFGAEMFGPAMAALERTLALNPAHFGALRGVGAIYDQLDEPRLAYLAYARAAEIRPHDDDLAEAMERLRREARGSRI